MAYIDLNSVRAGVVSHPAEWAWSGYNEIQAPRQRYSLIDYRALMEWLNISSLEVLQNPHLNDNSILLVLLICQRSLMRFRRLIFQRT